MLDNYDFASPRPMTQQERDAWLWQQPEWIGLLREEIGFLSPYFSGHDPIKKSGMVIIWRKNRFAKK